MTIDPYTPPNSEPALGPAPTVSGHLTSLFGFRGRITRKTFLVYGASSYLVGSILLQILYYFFPQSRPFHPQIPPIAEPDPVFIALSILLAIPAIWIALALQVKRWHDHSKSAWWLLIWLTPLGLLWVIVELGLVRGSPYPNKYGPDPLRPNKSL